MKTFGFKLVSYRWWNRLLIYTLFCFSTFTIAGENISITGLYAIFLLRFFRNRNLWKVPHPVFYTLLIFLFFNILSGLTSPYSHGAGFALRDNLHLFLPWILYFALEDVDEQTLLRLFFYFLVLISIYGIIQYFTGADWFRTLEKQSPTPYKHPCYSLYGYTDIFHAKGNFTHHLTYGGVLLLCFPLFVSLSFCKEISKNYRRVFKAGSVVIFTAILASLARSIWLGSMFALLVLCFRLPKKWLILIVCIGIGMMSAMLWHYTFKDQKLSEKVTGPGLIWQRLESGFVLKYNQDRYLLWQSAWQAIKDHPWFGIGLNNDGEVMPRYRKPIIKETGHQFFNSASAGVHNIYLQTWVNLGIFGLISYIMIWVSFFLAVWQTLRNSRVISKYNISLIWGGFAGISGFLVAGIFENNFRDSEVQTVLLMIMALVLNAARKNKISKPY
ncbi:MAG: O-antigen ligase family protein [SAR324 cluster bacterium]|nr:O-antigen ligase family protein [SAR324 cluster bacterium]